MSTPGKTRLSFIIPINKIDYFLCPKNGIRGIYFLSCLCVLNKTNFNLGPKFKTVRDRDFIFGIHTRLMQTFHMMPGSSPRNLDRDLYTKISHFRLSCLRGHSFANITFFISVPFKTFSGLSQFQLFGPMHQSSSQRKQQFRSV